jgi:hypothetical protein
MSNPDAGGDGRSGSGWMYHGTGLQGPSHSDERERGAEKFESESIIIDHDQRELTVSITKREQAQEAGNGDGVGPWTLA